MLDFPSSVLSRLEISVFLIQIGGVRYEVKLVLLKYMAVTS
jgi:hypothetical protein